MQGALQANSYRPYIYHNSDQAETIDLRPLLAVLEQDGKFASLSSQAGYVLK